MQLSGRFYQLQSSLDETTATGRRDTANKSSRGEYLRELLNRSAGSDDGKQVFSMTTAKFNETCRSSGSPKLMVSSQGLSKSKAYYQKYIHNENVSRLRAQQKSKGARYIPQDMTEKKTFKEKFVHYMKQMDVEEAEDWK